MRLYSGRANTHHALALLVVLAVQIFAANAFAQDAKVVTPRTPLPCDERPSEFSILVRSDFSDLGPLSCTHDLISAQGATFSATNNLLTSKNSLSGDGLIAFDYTRYDGNADIFKGFSIGAFVQADDTYQLQSAANQPYNGYALTSGGFAEFAVFNKFAHGIDNFRVRDGEATASTGTRSNSFVAEWIPQYVTSIDYLSLGLPVRVGPPPSPLWYSFSPELMVQYDRFDSGPKTAAIFASGIDALRVGPQMTLRFAVEEENLPAAWDPRFRSFLANSSVSITNHESWEQYTGKQYAWTAAVYSYTFPGANKQSSHIGLSASYGFGSSESSGNLTKQAKVGLAVKF